MKGGKAAIAPRRHGHYANKGKKLCLSHMLLFREAKNFAMMAHHHGGKRGRVNFFFI